MRKLDIAFTALATAVVLLAGTREVRAQAPAEQVAAAAIDPIGGYDFLATFGIQARAGTIDIAQDADGSFSGEIRLEGESDAAVIDNVVVSGSHLQILAFVNGTLMITAEMDFTGAVFEGTITAGDETILIDGTRRAE